jgi:hypothetical protein
VSACSLSAKKMRLQGCARLANCMHNPTLQKR